LGLRCLDRLAVDHSRRGTGIASSPLAIEHRSYREGEPIAAAYARAVGYTSSSEDERYKERENGLWLEWHQEK
jgi:hypothetical protein